MSVDLERVGRARLSRESVAELAGELTDAESTSALIDAAVADPRAELATIAMLAADLAGWPPSCAQVASHLARVVQPELIGLLLGAAADPDPGLLVATVADWQTEQVPVVLFFVSELLRDAPAPPELLVVARGMTRYQLRYEEACLMGAVARWSGDQALRDLCGPWEGMQDSVGGQETLGWMRRAIAGPADQVLPRMAPAASVEGFTIRRAAVKVGRNEPCPCGSGKKYKKCCADKAAERLADPSPVPGLTMTEYLAEVHRHVTPRELAWHGDAVLLALDPTELSTEHLLSVVRTLGLRGVWEGLEPFVDTLDWRADLPEGWEHAHWRDELLASARAHGQEAWVRRLVEALGSEGDAAYNQLGAALLADEGEALRQLEELLGGAFLLEREDSEQLINLAYLLLETRPALGIAVARAALDPRRSMDVHTVLDEVERARDRLLLPPGDPAWEVYDLLCQEADARLAAERVEARESEQTANLNAKLRASRDHARSVEAELAQQRRALEAREAELAGMRARAESASGAAEALDEAQKEMARQRQKIAELKGLTSEALAEQRQLRQALAEARTESEAGAGAASAGSEEVEDDGLETAVSEGPRVSLRVPEFAARARAALGKVPAEIGAQALAAAGELGGGDREVWRRTKKVTDMEGVYSFRLGLYYRMLVRPGDGVLEVLEVIHRQDLDRTIKRYR